ncbi:MAG TPA: hypothetical protein VNZ53_55725 [Steroidobacteraceae bacterium]|nr:hypothetical protein [Steroidobacteraceae bacterium]
MYRSYFFGAVRVATLTLLTLTALSACLSCGVVTAKVSGHAVTLRSSPTVLADTFTSPRHERLDKRTTGNASLIQVKGPKVFSVLIAGLCFATV